MILKTILGFALHGYTVFIAYNLNGWLVAFITLLFPGVAQVFWIISVGIQTGIWLNLLTIFSIAYISLWVFLAVIGTFIVNLVEDENLTNY